MYAARFLLFVTLVSYSTIGSLSAQGSFDIAFNSGSSFAANPAAEAAFARAINQWEAFIDDPIMLSIDVDFAAFGATTVASAAPVSLNASYATVGGAIFNDALDEADDAITLSLPSAGQISFDLPSNFTFNGNLEITKANLKALGFTGLDATFGVSDGQLLFGSGIEYDFDNSDGVTAGATDFETIAVHEIAHILGVISAVDQVDALLNDGVTTGAILPTPFDLYRFEDGSVNDPATALEFNTATRSLIPGSDDVFDQVLAGPGLTELQLSTGAFNGDGRQASHFEDNLNLGVLDPTFGPGEIAVVSANDARVLDLIGYDITITSVPEPSSVSLMMWLAGPVMLLRRRA